MESMEIAVTISQELGLTLNQVTNTVALLEADNTIPFIARYRKEVTGNLDEVQIGAIEIDPGHDNSAVRLHPHAGAEHGRAGQRAGVDAIAGKAGIKVAGCCRGGLETPERQGQTGGEVLQRGTDRAGHTLSGTHADLTADFLT